MTGEEPNEAAGETPVPLPGGSFKLLVQRIGYQCLMSLGVLENPITNTREKNLASARMLLDDLQMLERKTQGNLDAEEEEHLKKVLGDLENAFEQRGA